MQTQTIGSQQHAGSPSASRTVPLFAAALAALLGMMVVWGVGLSPIAALHNAAHDTRHSMAFPCH